MQSGMLGRQVGRHSGRHIPHRNLWHASSGQQFQRRSARLSPAGAGTPAPTRNALRDVAAVRRKRAAAAVRIPHRACSGGAAPSKPAGFVGWYLQLLDRHPLPTKCATAGVIVRSTPTPRRALLALYDRYDCPPDLSLGLILP